MQPCTESPGFLFDTLYMAAPELLSPTTTVPALKPLPEFVVVEEKAENVPYPAIAPRTPTMSTDESRRRGAAADGPTLRPVMLFPIGSRLAPKSQALARRRRAPRAP